MNGHVNTPAWHQQTYCLTPEEISNPVEVLTTFCWEYSPSEIRTKLKDWYAASLSDEEADSKSIFVVYENIEKLIEAVYLINAQNSLLVNKL
ncbi:hypothetical protein [Chitinophaga arvensicola]|uniref:Uncharacterized protein n=1 Tax=Chitinophaga arvensicola TaxID=29529 RepID=A0A1I0S6Q8_9BACT|nr:hypothetical protein [Chitinophaga arvensicola]SEW51212.1 hypothetical protein SAMN04488122_4171 [Chitinophaga arvensicola]